MKKPRIWLAFLLITVLCWIDYSQFTDVAELDGISDTTRRIAHIIILMLIIPLGYWGLAAATMQWMKRIWLLLYVTGLVVILIAGILQWQWQLFSVPVLDRISDIRLFLTSPIPYFILLLLPSVLSREKRVPDGK